MRINPHRLALDALTALLAVGGLILVIIGGSPPAIPHRATDTAGSGSTASGSTAASTGGALRAGGAPTAGAGSSAGGGVGAGDGSANQGPPAPRTGTARPGQLGPSTPVHLDIPAIGVSTELMVVGLNPDGTIAVPPVRADAPAAWYRYLPTPGEVGPAVIVGHVDTARDGPAVFYRLRELRAGDAIAVRRRDGSVATFTVSSVTQYSKDAFPSESVYGPIDYPGLRLITCGGSFDQLHRQYRGNIVVYARTA
jgi:hypothetical protein